MKLKHQSQSRYIVDGKLILADNFKEALAKYMEVFGSGGIAYAARR